MVTHLLCEIDFLSTAISFNLNESSSGSIVGRDKDAVTAHNGRGYIGRIVGCTRVLPKKFSIFEVESQSAFLREEYYLRGVADLDRHRRGVTCFVALTLPNQRSILFI